MTITPTREYHVVACSMPIVYTLEGDHDPNGMAYVLKPIAVLLQWAKDRWEDGDKLLPRLHVRRQRAQLVIDGLERLDAMLERLRSGSSDDRALLAELRQRESQSEYLEEDDRLSYGSRREGGRSMAVRLNVQRQIDELRVALTDLQDVDGPNRWNQPEPEADYAGAEPPELDPATAPKPIRLVTLTSAQRREWRKVWVAQAKLLDQSIERGLANLDQRFLKDEVLLLAESHIPKEWMHRLLLNDYQPGTNRSKPCNRFNPMKPIPALRPLVLRCHQGETVKIKLENSLQGRRVGFHIQGEGQSTDDGDGVFYADGSAIGRNKDSTCKPGDEKIFYYKAQHEGVWPINDLADVRGSERGTNSHGLFGAIIVEPQGTLWCDPETGKNLTQYPWCGFLDVNIVYSNEDINHQHHKNFVDFYCDDVVRSFREFTVFIHDEPEVHSGLHTVGEHTIMPLSYRAEPMHNRLPHRMRKYAADSKLKPLPAPGKIDRTAVCWKLGDELDEQFWTARDEHGEWLERVAGEEQHHSSWLFGDPITHIQRAYAGDPCRVRLVHAGVKETHVYHLHVHQWRSVATDTAPPSVHGADETGNGKPKGGQLLDSITIGPQSAQTIDPLYGSGSRQQAMADVIWHCHLYPHFHHGMWGLWRSHDRLVDGNKPYPDGSYCPPLEPLPGRKPEDATLENPGFPWFIDGVFPMKSPPPPVGEKTPQNGRRLLLKMGPASKLEKAAMPPGQCRNGETPGAVFVDLDGKFAEWNKAADLPKPRIVSYDVEVKASECHYNVDGWHDPIGHYYRLMKVQIREWSETAKDYQETHSETFPVVPGTNPSPFYPRANHGDVVELRLHNRLNSFPADAFDLGQLPVECGLHVHLVKFDPLSADGSSTGWNYLAGASCREAVGADGPGEMRTVSLHRWMVDEEFGPCFFHDHLLANYRQKHGLYAALIAEPHGSQWQDVEDQSVRAWASPEAIVVPPIESGVPPFREACIGIGDFVPLLDETGRPLNPPSTLSGDDDPGAMAVNYRSAPMTFRGPDPSLWFSSSVRSRPNFVGVKGDPDTPVIRTYPGERLRIRLIQGSHEEQHGFALHGLRWRREWGNGQSPLVNQQTLGISEAFTLDINPEDASHYGPGDYLWHFCAADDIWLGCWGLVRSLYPTPENFAQFSPLPDLKLSPSQAREKLKMRSVPDLNQDSKVRTFVVAAQRTEHLYSGTTLTDPWGLIYRVVNYDNEGDFKNAFEEAVKQNVWEIDDDCVRKTQQPLVLRARRGEWVRVILVNDLFDFDHDDDDDELEGRIKFGVEPSPARLPLEHLDEFQWPDRRTVSSRVSIHASLLSYDVMKFDGSYVGRNFDSTIAPSLRLSEHVGTHMGEENIGAVVHRQEHQGSRNWCEYWWYADEKLAPESYVKGPGQVCYLHDMADIRNHRHHGLIGALIVEPADVTPFKLGSPHKLCGEGDGWTELNAELRSGTVVVAKETVAFVQDGLRFFVNGDPDLPMRDVNPGDDPEDSGQKAINYRSHPVHHGVVSRKTTSVFPMIRAQVGDQIWLRVIGAGDKPRQHTMTLHGCAWKQASWMQHSPFTGAFTGLSPCRADTIVATLSHKGDYALRAGGFRWSAEQGVWSSLRAREKKQGPSSWCIFAKSSEADSD